MVCPFHIYSPHLYTALQTCLAFGGCFLPFRPRFRYRSKEDEVGILLRHALRTCRREGVVVLGGILTFCLEGLRTATLNLRPGGSGMKGRAWLFYVPSALPSGFLYVDFTRDR